VSKPPDFWRIFERDNNFVIDMQRELDRGNSSLLTPRELPRPWWTPESQK